MKADGLFIFMCLLFLFAAWFVTGGPLRPIATAGPYITPVARPGEESQGYRITAPANPVNPATYPKQIKTNSVSTTSTNIYTRPTSVAPYYQN